MSPASYLTAPPRVAAASVPKQGATTMPSVPWWTLVSLAVFGAVFVLATVVIAVAVARTLRAVQDVRQTLGGELGALAVAAEDVQERIELVAERRALVASRLASLERSKRKLDVLVWALRDVRSFVARARGAIPRK